MDTCNECFATQPALHYNTRHHKPIWYSPNKFDAYGEEEIQAVVECLRNGWLAPGPRTVQFKKEVSAYFGKASGIFCNSGSSGNLLALKIAGLNDGDEVITPACTFSTVVAPLVQLRLKVVFCYVEVTQFVPSIAQVKACITDNMKAIFLPNLAGSKPDWEGLQRLLVELKRDTGPTKIWLIEDSCDTMTHTSASDISVISFYASHIITAGWTGGMVMFNGLTLREEGLGYRDWGRAGNNAEDPSERFGYQIDGIDYDFKFLYTKIGFNFKCSEMNAAFGLVQMQKLPQFVEIRRANVDRYMYNLAGMPYILPDDSDKQNWLAFPVLVPASWKRKEILQHIEKNGIQTRVFLAGNICRHPALASFSAEKEKFPNSDIIMRDCFMLGAHHGLTKEDIDYVCTILKEFKPSS